jgi:hypothetical protein
MLSLVTAAEHQYRHDTWNRDRDNALLASIRERRLAEAEVVAPLTAPVVATPARARRAAWARPIGVHPIGECSTTACAIA